MQLFAVGEIQLMLRKWKKLHTKARNIFICYSAISALMVVCNQYSSVKNYLYLEQF